MKTKEEILKEKIKLPFTMPNSELLIYEAMEEYAQQFSLPVEAGVSGQIAEVTEPEKLVLQHIKLPLSIDQMSRYMFDSNMNMIAETRGWGWIQYKEDAELLQDTLGEMIVKAFNKVYGG